MKNKLLRYAAHGSYAAVLILGSAFLLASSSPGGETDGVRAVPPHPTLPIAFVANQGQWEAAAQFVARRGGMTALLEPGALVVQLEPRGADDCREAVAVRLAFEGASETVTLAGEEEQEGLHNFFVGERSKWRSAVPGFGSVLYRGLYPGVDLRVREGSGMLEYDVLLAPGAELDDVVIRCEGIAGLELEADGSLVMQTALGPIRQRPPTTWMETPSGERRAVECRYRLIDGERYGFAVRDLDPSLALVIDPELEWSTYLGGSLADWCMAVTVDSAGDVFMACLTQSIDIDVTDGSSLSGTDDAHIAKLSADGSTLLWATYLGGSDLDWAFDLVLDDSGDVLVAGLTRSTDFPTTPGAFDTTAPAAGDIEGFVARLSGDGTELRASTWLGGTDEDFAVRLDLDATGAVTVGGTTSSNDFPTTPGVFDETHNGGRDAFVSRLSGDLTTLIWSTYLGGFGEENYPFDPDFILDMRRTQVVVDEGTQVTTAAVSTWSPNFPTTAGAYQETKAGAQDVAVVQLSSSGSTVLFSTFLGGTNHDSPGDLDVHVSGGIYVSGFTYSSDFPTTPGAFQTTFAGAPPPYVIDGFVARLSSDGSALEWSTLLGGFGIDSANGIELAGGESVVVVGFTTAADFSTTLGAFGTTHGGGTDAFVALLDAKKRGLAQLVYSSFLGGADDEYAVTVDLDDTNAATVGGGTTGPDFPTTPGAHDESHAGGLDGFASRLDMLPTGAGKYGASTPGCAGPLAIGVTSMPQAGSTTFGFTCTKAPVSGSGYLGLSFEDLTTPLPVLGVDIWIDPASLIDTLSASSDASGFSEVPTPIPPTVPAGTNVYAQFLWLSPCGPQGLSASNAMAITIQ